ncbi:MAG TPA: VOC family protein [Paenibacillus sp.]|uniref:VOC family protein n=1 Tax=Paenibacillus sp. TaxID=58172 RepID=UPI002C910EC4|nr:VOC family protein [Paenibacillus sp.]HUC91393.1 VOC family protein [Paenibacillus sp.]
MSVRLCPYLVFDGNAKGAVNFYQQALDARLVNIQTFGELPEDSGHPLPAEAKDRVMHALLKVGDTDLMISDTFPGTPYQAGDNVNITVITDNAEQTNVFYEALKQGGEVKMPLQETFWSPAYGMVKDKFGVTFQLSTEERNR